MRIIIFSDSLGRPRPDLKPEERTEYEDTYPYLVKKHFASHEIEIIYVESLDSDDAIFWNERMVAFRRPDIVVYHFGINDCAPRIFKKGSRSFLFAPWVRALTKDVFLRLIHKSRRALILTLSRGKRYVHPEKFRANLEQMKKDVLSYSPKAQFYMLGISSKPGWYEHRSPGINQSIEDYNALIKAAFGSHYLEIKKGSALISDGIHFTKETHAQVAAVLIEEISKSVSR